MAWQTLTVHADAEYAEGLSEALLELGALSVDMHDADADTPEEQARNLVNKLFEEKVI